MKSFLKTFLMFGMLFLCSGSLYAQNKAVQTATIKTTIYCDHCKVCETCGKQFNRTLLREKGIQMVMLDEKEMTIQVTYNSKKTDLAKIKKAISKLGYDADEVQADAVAYEALDGCCKK